ncbi:MAG: hypothetical protein ACI4JY_09235, partial [Oscillospiraceae bacterium]
LLFHNDLDNTTAALPDILKSLKADGYELVGVEDLIYPDNYTINSEGRQIRVSESLIDLDAQKVEEVMAQYSEQIQAAGITKEQLSAIAAAVKSKDLSSLPDDIKPIAAQVMAKINESGNSSPDTSTPDNSSPENSAPAK